MLQSLNKKYPFNDNLKVNVRVISSVSLGIFLFLLFFQPYPVNNPDFNNRLLILATFGAITLVFLSILRLVIPSIFPKAFSEERWTIKKEILVDLLFVVLNSVAFVFFARYVGHTPMNFLNVIIIVIISITSATIMVVTNQLYLLKKEVERLREFESKFNANPEEEAPAEIQFESENKSEYFQLPVREIILIKSANNYIEVIYKKDEKLLKRLIRSTLKTTEELLSKSPEMIRCHRSCIVNRDYIREITRRNDGLILLLQDYDQEIHVSRQYALRVKEALKMN